jgi:predicted secreted protein
MPGLGTAGYIWQHEIDDPSGAVDVRWERGFPEGRPPAAVGVSAPEVATITALAPGRATLRLVQRRPWERDAPPLHAHTVEVRVS